jgi:tol-pal system protein YbgF
MEQAAKPGDLAKKLESLEAKVEGLRIAQQGFDQKLGELLRQADEASRRPEPPRSRESTKIPGQAEAGGAKADADAGVPPKSSGSEPLAALTPTASYNQAYNDYLKGNYDLAITGFEEFLKKFPTTSLTPHAQYWIGESYFNKRAYRQAIDAYEHVITNYPKSDKVAPALAKAGVAYAEMGNAAKARDLLKQVIERYPQSAEAALAKRRLADLK